MRNVLLAAMTLALTSTPAHTQLRVASSGDLFVTRLCQVYSRGDVYCRNVEQLLQNEWRVVDAAELHASFRKIYKDRGLNQQHNGLMSCGSETFAAAPQSQGANPTPGDITAARNSCLRELEKRMSEFGVGRGRGRSGVFGGAPWNPGSGGGGSSWTGTTCTAGDPTRSAADLGKYVTPLRECDSECWRQQKEAAGAKARDWDEEARRTNDFAAKEKAAMYREDSTWFAQNERMTREAEANEKKGEQSGSGGSAGRTGSGMSTCQEVDGVIREKFAECERNDWSSYECQKMKGCSDPAVTNPIPNETGARAGAGSLNDNEQRPGMSCGDVPLFGDDDLRRAVQEYCNERAKYGPDGGGLCGGSGPGASRRTNDGSPGSPRDAACGIRALNTETGCLVPAEPGSVFPSLRRNFQMELLKAHKKLGGPVVVLPVKNPGVAPGGPRGPRPGASNQSSPTQSRPNP